MLSSSRTAIQDVLPYFSRRGVDVAFLVPTETGYAKSIMDATATVRSFLLRNGIHDYSVQAQGPEHKVVLPAMLVLPDGLRETTVSLYRPVTKSGDPRIWFRGLKDYCKPTDLLGLVAADGILHVFDLSNVDVVGSIRHKGYAAWLLDQLLAEEVDDVVSELLVSLGEISRLGFVETLVPGDTGIGMTLEHLLGITPNASKAPDYKGIEIKATREGVRTKTRVNLFSQVPDWTRSALPSAQRLLDTYGYWREKSGRQQLYCTISAVKPNPQGLYFHVAEDEGLLRNRSLIGGVVREVVQWDTELLRSRLEEKHAETFWVKADCAVISEVEHFHYLSVVHTRKPLAHQLENLIAGGIITMDYTISQPPGGRIRDHGYLFKIHPDNVELLFPDPIVYSLVDF